jgi:hypothetical protein
MIGGAALKRLARPADALAAISKDRPIRSQSEALLWPDYHAFINQKIMPRSATLASVSGVGRPARKY